MAKKSDGRPKRVTMTDVARRAGVSQPTVSFVLNDRRDVAVAEETRRRVLQAAAELDFVPNRAAQLLRSNKSFTVGVVTSGIVSQPYAGLIVLGLQQVVQPAGYVCMVVDTTDDPGQGDDAVASLVGQGVAAIVYASLSPKPLHRSPRLDGIRTIFVNCWPEEGHADTILLADEYAGGRAAAASVFERGHREVAFLGGMRNDYACKERRRGFDDAARAAGLRPADLVHRYGNYQIGNGYDLATEVITEHAPTALVCGNDRMAIGALLALHALGLECPRDVSIVGFDNQPDVADQVRPGLTTAELPHLMLGRRAGELVVAGPDDAPERVIVECPLIERDSVGDPPRRRPRVTAK
ncbi:LacI family transcriptional regulator [Kribbella sp. VKM Ac-2571]|uniref:LacI family DNA-binding transcriptional regulator n=1 Tax=Kribbella sp. VKM Ac-2571 TaxID=2512222 RepID=UPI00105DFB58|nr:LacI family DNA-binding transcriptional regulator [Kribbella sp. VKM Ac-2571]TDO49019.1 LacI family transcriptional regulator [Kribbella sp. VKM Ac-2571]